jgi:hypothetical protein
MTDLTREYRHLSICSKGMGPVADCHICRNTWEAHYAKHGEAMLAPPRTEGQLVAAYQEMYEHTRPECGKCKVPFNCCSAAACDGTMAHALDQWDVTLPATGHPKLPLMGEQGCTAAPHLRPLCTVHQCDISASGNKANDPAWTERYYELRERINDLEFEWASYRATEVRSKDSRQVARWEKGEIPGTYVRTLGNGATVTLGSSDSNYPPGTPEGERLNLNTTALWLKVEVPDHEAAGYPFPLGWWARLQSARSLHKAKGQIDRFGYTLPPEMLAEYWQARVFEMEANMARAKRFCEEYLATTFKPRLIETFQALHEHQKTLGWSGEPK